MRAVLFTLGLSLFATGCSEPNYFGEPLMTDQKLSETQITVGWNFEVERAIDRQHHFDVTIQPDDTYVISVSQYADDGVGSETIASIDGQLTGELAQKLRRDLDLLRPPPPSSNGPTSLPNCPQTLPPDIEHYVGFGSEAGPLVTIIERNCTTEDSMEARAIVVGVLSEFDAFNPDALRAGSLTF